MNAIPGTSGNYNYLVSSLVGTNTGGNDRLFLSPGLTSVAEEIPFEFSPGLGILISSTIFGSLILIKKRQQTLKINK